MRSDSKTYEEVAKNCRAFTPSNDKESFSNSVSDTPEKVSCVNCQHFTQDKYCELDLYDQIVVNKKLF